MLIVFFAVHDTEHRLLQWEHDPNAGEWHLFGLNSSAWVERYSILDIRNVGESTVTARGKLSIDFEGEYEEETASIQLLLEGGKWCVDEIITVKKNLKDNMK